MEKMKDRLFDELAPEKRAPFGERLAFIEDEMESHVFLTRELVLRHDARGANTLDRWLASGAEGLNNDERNLLRGYVSLRPALLEVRGFVDGQLVQVVDLLEEKEVPRLLADPTAAAQAGRFTTLFTWVYDTPHFLRLRGGACLMDDCGEGTQADNLRTIARHLGFRGEDRMLRSWLSDHFLRVAAAIQAVQTARWEQLMELAEGHEPKPNHDPDLVPPQLLERTRERPCDGDIEEDPSDQEHLEDPQAAACHAYYRTFPDRPIAMLDCVAPRAAATDPALRPRLVELMKKHVRGLDQMRREQGLDLDLNGLLTELGLHEIVFPAPPLGEQPPESEQETPFSAAATELDAEQEGTQVAAGGWQDAEADDFEDDDYDPVEALHETDWAGMPGFNQDEPPPQPLLSGPDLDARISTAIQASRDDGEGWEAEWPDLAGVAHDLMDEMLREESHPRFHWMLAALTEVLHPERPSRLEFNAPRLGWHFSKTLQEFEDLMVESDDADDVIENFLRDSIQPEVCLWIGNEAMGTTRGTKRRFTDDEVFVMLPLFKAVIWELSH